MATDAKADSRTKRAATKTKTRSNAITSLSFPDDLAPWVTELFEIARDLRILGHGLSALPQPHRTSEEIVRKFNESDEAAGKLLTNAYGMGCFGRFDEMTQETLTKSADQSGPRVFTCNLSAAFCVRQRMLGNDLLSEKADEYQQLANEVECYGWRLRFWSIHRDELRKTERAVEPIIAKNQLGERITKGDVATLKSLFNVPTYRGEWLNPDRDCGKAYPADPLSQLEQEAGMGRVDALLTDRRMVWGRVSQKVEDAILGAAQLLGLGESSKSLLDNWSIDTSHDWNMFRAVAVADDEAAQRARPAPTATELRALAERLRKLAKAIFQSGLSDQFVKSEAAQIPNPLVTGWYTRANAWQDKKQKQLFGTICSLLGQIYSGRDVDSPRERLESLADDLGALAATLEPQTADTSAFVAVVTHEPAHTLRNSVSVTISNDFVQLPDHGGVIVEPQISLPATSTNRDERLCGVSFLDAAKEVHPGDPDEIEKTKKRWANADDKPASLGFCKNQSQTELYDVAILVKWIFQKGDNVDHTIKSLSNALNRIRRDVDG